MTKNALITGEVEKRRLLQKLKDLNLGQQDNLEMHVEFDKPNKHGEITYRGHVFYLRNNPSKGGFTFSEFINYRDFDWIIQDSGGDTLEEVELMQRVLFKTLEWLYLDFHTNSQTDAVLSMITENNTALFGSETYNGWDNESNMEYYGCSEKEALMRILTYCITKCYIYTKYLKTK